jgi:hypothetical protein
MGVYLMMKPELSDGFSWRGLGQAAVLVFYFFYPIQEDILLVIMINLSIFCLIFLTSLS